MNRLRAAMHRPGPVIGTVVHLDSPTVIELAALAGFDFVVIDLEHGALGMRDVENLIRAADAAGIATSIRVGRGDRNQINRALDTGTDGLWFPVVSSAEEAETLVDWSRPKPLGSRGACPETRSGRYLTLDIEEYRARAQDVVLTMMIESREGVEALPDIAAVPGVDLLMVGPIDLAADLDCALDDPRIVETRHRAIELARTHNLDVIESAFSPETVREWTAAGSRIFSYGLDTVLVQRGFAADVAAARAAAHTA